LAPTGTGKTETAMLPVLDAIHEARDAPGDEPREGISALYITPLRALNRDMMDRLEWWGDRLDVEVAVRHGDTSQYERSTQADDPPDVLITTPESLQAILTGSKMRVALEAVAHVVIDEVHELASAKRGAQLTVGLERLRRVAGPFQRIGLSATVGSPDAVGRFLVGCGRRDPDRPGDRAFETVEVAAGSRTDVRVCDPPITDRDSQLAGELAIDETTASHVRTIRETVREQRRSGRGSRRSKSAIGRPARTRRRSRSTTGRSRKTSGSTSKTDSNPVRSTGSSVRPRWNSASTWAASTTWSSTGAPARSPGCSSASGGRDTVATGSRAGRSSRRAVTTPSKRWR
jgi:ATP-dependent Lhr-like helicase